MLEGWYKSAACKDNEKWNFDTDKVTSNITLYAKWVATTPANDEKKGSEQKKSDSTGDDGRLSFISGNYADIYLRTDANDRALNSKLLVTAGKNVTVKWGKVKGADGYDVYMAYTGKDNSLVKTVKSTKTSAKVTKLSKKKINRKKTVKCCVIAYKMVDGKKVILAKSLDVKSYGDKDKKNSDVKSISLKTSVSSIYASSNPKVATVSKKGKCYIWIYAANGRSKKVKVTVK